MRRNGRQKPKGIVKHGKPVNSPRKKKQGSNTNKVFNQPVSESVFK